MAHHPKTAGISSGLNLEFIDQEVTAWGGLSILKRLMDQSRFIELLRTLPLPIQGSNRGHNPVDLLVQFMASVWCGANRYAHLDVSRFDLALQRLFGWKSMPEHKAYQRYFDKFNMEVSQKVFGELYRWFFSRLAFNNFTLDIDSTVITRHGSQEAAAKGYNANKRGRKSHHPIIAFVAEVEMVANFWLRPGSSHTANNLQAFLEETLGHFPGKRIGLLRLDSGFCARSILEHIEGRPERTDYVIAVPMRYSVQKAIAEQKSWLRIDAGIEISEFHHQVQGWDRTRRMIAVRQKLSERPEAVGKQLSLFVDDIEIGGYRYTCYVTSLGIGAADVWRLYRGRANCENRIKELKYDYGLDKMNQASFDGTEASMGFMSMAYNFMSLLRQCVIGDKVRNRLGTLRYKMLAIPAMVEHKGGTTTIKMALQMRRRAWIVKLWDNAGCFCPSS